MSDYFYSLAMLIVEHYRRAASALRERELREASDLYRALELEDNA